MLLYVEYVRHITRRELWRWTYPITPYTAYTMCMICTSSHVLGILFAVRLCTDVLSLSLSPSLPHISMLCMFISCTQQMVYSFQLAWCRDFILICQHTWCSSEMITIFMITHYLNEENETEETKWIELSIWHCRCPLMTHTSLWKEEMDEWMNHLRSKWDTLKGRWLHLILLLCQLIGSTTYYTHTR